LYKIPASTLFTGKNLVFVPECHSTNTLALQLCQQTGTSEGTVIITNNQTSGRGQRGNSWEANPGENLTFSMILKPAFLKASEQFLLNQCVSLALYDFLSQKADYEVKIKWPNDMLIQDRKVCGMLIENLVQRDLIQWSVIGIGLNVNQTEFASGRATSLRTCSGFAFILVKELHQLLSCIEARYLSLRQGNVDLLKKHYNDALLGFQKTRKFNVQHEEIEGIIQGVDAVGRLMVQTQHENKIFDIKEIEFVY
jgi:BirA family transcriptional regulator, biotin operon repressor / biotin---[acetyl-CoA-carboxylase] ligase